MSDAASEGLSSVSVNMRPRWAQQLFAMPQPANVIALQPGLATGTGPAPEAYLTFGHITPPNYFNAEDAEAATDENGVLEVDVVPIARLVLNVQRLRQLQAQITQFLDAIDGGATSDD